MIKKIINFTLLFLTTFLITDLFLSLVFEKEFYHILWKKWENELITWDVTREFWRLYGNDEFKFIIWNSKNNDLWSLFWVSKSERWNWYWTGECSIYWLWDSITYWMWVDAWQEYLARLSELFNNNKVYNYWINWHWIYQSYFMNEKYINPKEKDLVIWQFFWDDFLIFKYVFWRIYNTGLNIDYLNWTPIFSNLLWNNINNFLLKNSYLYNKLLIFKTNSYGINSNIDSKEYLLSLIDSFLSYKKVNNENVLFIFWIDYNLDIINWNWEIRGEYRLIMNLLDKYGLPYINLADSKILTRDMFLSDGIHFTVEWNKNVADIIYKKIKDEELLPNKCY